MINELRLPIVSPEDACICYDVLDSFDSISSRTDTLSSDPRDKPLASPHKLPWAYSCLTDD